MDENEKNFENSNLFDVGDESQPIIHADETVKKTFEENSYSLPIVNKDMHKKDTMKYKIIALCAIFALVGSMIGGVASGLIVKKAMRSDKSENETTTAKNVSEQTVPVTSGETTTAASSSSEKENTTDVKSGTYTSNDEKPALDLIFDARDIYKYNVDSVVSIEVTVQYGKGYGTGFIISEEGYIVTNYHVVDGAKSVLVTLHDDRQFNATVVGYEETNDIAVIKIKPDGEIHSLIYGVSSDLSVGDPVYVIGNPLGDLTFTLTTGVVSALNRLIDTDTGMQINMFQTNAAINSGNSGGPVFDEHGFVVGIASAKYASASIEGLGFCIPIDDVRSMIDEIINKGYVSGKPLMGISVYDREVSSYGFFQSTRQINGAKIAAVGANTAGARAGLAEGDVITSADGKQVTSVSVLRTILSNHRSGDTISLVVNRNGSSMQVNITLDEYEPASPRTSYSNVYDL